MTGGKAAAYRMCIGFRPVFATLVGLMATIITVLLIFVMVGFNALYVAAEFATVGSRRSRVQESAESGSGSAQGLLTILQDPKRLDNYVAACQVGITLSSLIAGAYGQRQLQPIFEDLLGDAGPALSIIVVLLLITTLQVVLGELLPKTVALRYPESLAMATLAPMRISQWLLRPFVIVFNGSAFWIMKRLGLSVDHSHSHIHSPEELAGLYRESAAGGLIDSAEREMLAGALAVSGRLVREIMTPRRRMVTIEGSTPIGEALAELSASPYSRFPVTDGAEEVIGLVALRELFIAAERGDAVTVADVATEATVVSEVFEVSRLLNTFWTGSHVAIVVNEFGSISGMVTREDAVEEILGEVNDEFDVEPDPITVEGSMVAVRGDVLLSQLNERFEFALPEDDVDTVSGYVWLQVGRLPVVGDNVVIITSAAARSEADGDQVSVSDLPTMRVEAVDGTLVERVSFALPEGLS